MNTPRCGRCGRGWLKAPCLVDWCVVALCSLATLFFGLAVLLHMAGCPALFGID